MGHMPHPVLAVRPGAHSPGRRPPRPLAGAAGLALGAAVAALAGLAGLAGLATTTLLTTRPHRYGEAGVPETEVGVVLGAEVYPDGAPSPSLRGRLDLAVRLYRAGKVQRLIVSGAEESNAQVSQMARYLVEHGVASRDVTLDPLGVDTYATCSRAQGVYGLRRATMISTDYHLPRILAICRAIGLEAYGVGDRSVRLRAPREWRRSVRREIAANTKMLFDLARHRYRTA